MKKYIQFTCVLKNFWRNYMNRPAMRFLGHMASRSIGIVQGVATKNIFQVILEAGVNVAELAGEIVRYNETLKQTTFIEDYDGQVKKIYQKRTEQQVKYHQQTVIQIQEQQLIDLQLEEKLLQQSLEAFKQKRETQMLLDEIQIKENIEIKSFILDMLKTYNGILSLCFSCIEGTVVEGEEKQRLFEEYRKNKKQINELLKEIY